MVALSGGADSVALLLVLHHLGYRVEAAHCNFHLRGEESDRDERFCITLCDRLGVTLHRAHFDTRSWAQSHKVSIEMAARELRYAWFEQLRGDIGAEDICIAHHRDDNVETLLINLLRGTGLQGLCGMQLRQGHIVRPLLTVSHADILSYLKAEGQDYVIDSSNLRPDVTRNKIRLQVLPLLETINPAVRANIARTESHLTEAAHVVEAALGESVRETFHDGTVDIDRLLSQPSPEYTLFAIVSPYGFSPTQISEMSLRLRGEGSRLWTSPTHELLISRNCIHIRAKKPKPQGPMKIPACGVYRYEGWRLTLKEEPTGPAFQPAKARTAASIDADLLDFPLTLRHIDRGDRFCPFGMKGTRLVSDYLTDRKLNLFQKQDQLTLVDASGHILWLLGQCVDQRVRITPSTRRALICHAAETSTPLP